MRTTLKTLAMAAALAMTAGSAFAAEAGMKMDCCAKCSCCKDMKGDKAAPQPDQQPHQQHQQ